MTILKTYSRDFELANSFFLLLKAINVPTFIRSFLNELHAFLPIYLAVSFPYMKDFTFGNFKLLIH